MRSTYLGAKSSQQREGTFSASRSPTEKSTTRYLLVVPWSLSSTGGVTQVVQNLFRRLKACAEFQPMVMVGSWKHSVPAPMDDQDPVTYGFRLRSPAGRQNLLLDLAKWMAFSWPELARLRRFIRHNNISVVNVHFPGLSAMQFVVLRRVVGMNFKLLLSFHGMDIVEAIATRGFRRWLWHLMLVSADSVVSCSNALSDQIISFDPSTRARIATIYNGLDIDALLSSRDLNYRLDDVLCRRPFILSVASFEHKKGLDILIRSFASIRDAVPELALVLVGAERDQGPPLRALAAELALSESVFFFADVPHPRLHAFYSRATLFCLPSRIEPFGIVLLEAGAFGRAVVATAVGGIPEIITDGVTGRLVPPNDEAALARELRELLSSPNERASLGQSLKTEVEKRFTWSRALSGYLDLAHRH